MTDTATITHTGPRRSESSWIAESIALPFRVSSPILAVGPQLKNTACLVQDNVALISRVHGDLSTPENYRAFAVTVNTILEYLGTDDNSNMARPLIVHDLHPTYASTLFARTIYAERLPVQHHHAHGVACAIENGVELPVIAIVCDGTGYGTDGAIWGGEVLLCRAESFDRLAHLDYFALPGGDAAALAPWRCAEAVIHEAALNVHPENACTTGVAPASVAPASSRWSATTSFTAQNLRNDPHDVEYPGVSSAILSLLHRQLQAKVNTPPTSSLGRLFDAAAAILGITTTNTHEGEAAMNLQAAAEAWINNNDPNIEPYPFELLTNSNQPTRIDWRTMIHAMLEDNPGRRLQPARPECNPAPTGPSAYRFHSTIAAMLADAATQAAHTHGLKNVVLSGGCFMNALLTRMIAHRLEARGLSVVTHNRLSCGDAGLSLGQAVIGAAVAAKKRKTS